MAQRLPSTSKRDAFAHKAGSSLSNSSIYAHNGGTTSKLEHNLNEDEQNLSNTPAIRNILGFVEKYDRVEEQELLSQMSCHWLLSTDDFKIPIEHPHGLITQMTPLNENHVFLLIPYEEEAVGLDYRELHQIIRELTIGIYVLNQHPCLQLEANFDESTSCQLPPAYIDTKLGQIMINTDYWLKALWHGSYFPREKRIKFSERWRQMIDIDSNGVAQTKKSIFQEFLNSGLCDIAKDNEYSKIFNNDTYIINKTTKNNKNDKTSSLAFGVGMTAKNSAFHTNIVSDSDEDFSKQDNLDPTTMMNMDLDMDGISDEFSKNDYDLLINSINDISVTMTFGLKSIRSYKNMYEIEPEYSINTCCKADIQQLDNKKFEKIKPILNMHEKYLRDNFELKKEIKKNLSYLKIVSFLTPFLIGLKKRMKIPDMNNLLPLMTGDDVQTERELPPLMLGSDFKSKQKFYSFSKDERKYFNLHGGIQFELETCQIKKNCHTEFEKEYDKITEQTSRILKSYIDSEQLQEYKLPVIELLSLNNKKYWSIRIDLESYSSSPQKPFWVSKLNDDLSKLKPKRLPMTDIQIYDLFKKYFGYKKATKYKNATNGLRAASQRGLLNIFQSFTRKTPINRLSKHDEFGLCLTHYAAIFNRPLVISSLIMQSIDMNSKQQINNFKLFTSGPMPLHYAARCGSLDTVSCLLASYANISYADNEGWVPIHHAAYFDNVPVIKLLIRRQPELLEIVTKIESTKHNESAATRNETIKKTPLLVASSAGSLEAVKCLILLGANILYVSDNGYNLIHIAAHQNRTNIIEYFINNEYAQLPTWKILINMLTNEKEQDRLAAVKCLFMLTNQNKLFWSPILNNSGIEKLCLILKKYTQLLNQTNQELLNMLKQEEEISYYSISVLCNLSDEIDIKKRLCQVTDLSKILIDILDKSTNDDLHSRASILISDVVSADETNKTKFAQQGSLEKLIKLLDSKYEDILVNSVNAIEIMCSNNTENQNKCAENDIFLKFLNILDLNSDLLKSSIAAAISALTHLNQNNQLLAMQQGLLKPLVNLLKSRNMTVQLKVSMALESLAIKNQSLQNALLALDADQYMIRLLEDHSSLNAAFEYRKHSNQQLITFNLELLRDQSKRIVTIHLKELFNNEINHFFKKQRMYYVGATIKSNMEDWSIVVREQAGVTLWTLAGSNKPQRKMIAEKIGISQIISLLISKSEKLQYVGAKCVVSLVTENIIYQNLILKESGIDPLIRLLKLEKTSHRVLLAVVETIGAMCVDIAHVNNEKTQKELCEKGAIQLMLNILEKPPNKFIQIETAHSLACLILNRPNDDYLNRKIDIRIILNLLDTDDLEMRLKAGLAITVLAYNNHENQYEIRINGGISYEYYSKFFLDHLVDPLMLCKACFQTVVLARVITGRDHVWLTAQGIGKLCQLLLYQDNQVIIQTASYLSSLSHTQAGITDAIITCDAIDILCDHLYSPNEQIRFTSAVTLGYLTFNRTGARMLLHNCRNYPHLYKQLKSLLKPENKIAKYFTETFDTSLKLGLPKLLVNNKIKFYVSKDNKDLSSKTINEKESNEFKGFYNNKDSIRTINEESKFKSSSFTQPSRSISAPSNKKQKININEKQKELVKSDTKGEFVKVLKQKPSIGKRPKTDLELKNK